MDSAWLALLILVVLLGAWLICYLLFRRVTVLEYWRAVRYRKGRFVDVVGPGQFWVYRPRTALHFVDIRRRVETVAGQEVLSADGLPLKVSLVASYDVADPGKAINSVQDFAAALYLSLQIAAREIVGALPLDDVLAKRSQLGGELTQKVAPAAEELGLRLVSADIKDIMLPGEMKKVYAQVAKARQEGLAALELARGETAALRNLANIAKTLEDHPALLQLRALQRMSEAGGHTLVLNLPKEGPLPIPGPGRIERDAEG